MAEELRIGAVAGQQQLQRERQENETTTAAA
jgi:hypothetical protein